MYFRNHWDINIYQSVYNENEYQIDSCLKSKTVVDIGAHIGSFSILCLDRGAKKVFSYEAEKENFEILKKNAFIYGNKIETFNRAVWRSDVEEEEIEFGCHGNDNTGSGNMIFGEHKVEKVKTISLDHVLSNKKVDLLKLDCEFSEYGIILTSKIVVRVPIIVGEFHEINGLYDNFICPEFAKIGEKDRYTVEDLEEFFVKNNYRFYFRRNDGAKHLGNFIAKR